MAVNRTLLRNSSGDIDRGYEYTNTRLDRIFMLAALGGALAHGLGWYSTW